MHRVTALAGSRVLLSRYQNTAVALEAADEGVAEALDEAEATKRVKATMWLPRYPKLVPV